MRIWFVLIALFLISCGELYAQVDLNRRSGFGEMNAESGADRTDQEQNSGRDHDHVEVKDTIPMRIYSWVLTKEYSQITPIAIDTATIGFHNYNPIFNNSISNTHLGPVGSAYQSNIYFDRKNETSFYFLRNFEAYNRQIHQTRFFNTTKPFSFLEYEQGPESQYAVDQWFKAFFTQNIDPNTNLGFEFDVLKNKGPYKYQDSHHKFMNLWMSKNTERYSGYISGIKSLDKFMDNGGIQDSLVNTIRDPFDLITNITDGFDNSTNGLSFMTSHEYRFGKYIESIDSISEFEEEEFVPIAAIQYSADFQNYSRASFMNSGNDTYFPNRYISDAKTEDTITFRRFSQTFQLKALESTKREFSFGKRAFIENEIVKASHPVPYGYRTFTYSNVFVGGELNQTQSKFWNWSAYGKLALIGRNLGDALLKGTLNKPIVIGKDTTTIFLEGWYQDQSADIFQAHLLSNHYKWENDFTKQHELIIKGKINLQSLRMDAGANYALLSNFFYNDISGMPAQYNKEFSVFSLWANKSITLWRFGWIGKVVWQEVSNDAVLRMPTWNAYSSIHYSYYLFKVMKIQLGAEVYFNSRFYADNYNSATSQFYLQDEMKRGGYPLINLFANAKLKRTSAFVKYYHANSGLMGGDFFAAAKHPLVQTTMRFGFRWTFYD